MATISGAPGPGAASHPTGVGRGSVVKVGRFRSRGYGRGTSGRVSKVGRYRSRVGGVAGGGIRKVGRYRNRAN